MGTWAKLTGQGKEKTKGDVAPMSTTNTPALVPPNQIPAVLKPKPKPKPRGKK